MSRRRSSLRRSNRRTDRRRSRPRTGRRLSSPPMTSRRRAISSSSTPSSSSSLSAPAMPADSKVGGFTPSFTYDTRDNMFTPLRGTFVEALLGIFSPALGGDDQFERLQLIAIQYVPLL